MRFEVHHWFNFTVGRDYAANGAADRQNGMDGNDLVLVRDEGGEHNHSDQQGERCRQPAVSAERFLGLFCQCDTAVFASNNLSLTQGAARENTHCLTA